MSNKNIKQNHFLQIKKILDQVDKAGNNANHFRAIILMGDKNEKSAYSYIHAPQEDMEKLILSGLRNSETFACSVANAVEMYIEELQKKEQPKTDKDEKDSI